LWLRLGDDAIPLDGLKRALSGVFLEFAPIVLDAGASTLRRPRICWRWRPIRELR